MTTRQTTLWEHGYLCPDCGSALFWFGAGQRCWLECRSAGCPSNGARYRSPLLKLELIEGDDEQSADAAAVKAPVVRAAGAATSDTVRVGQFRRCPTCEANPHGGLCPACLDNREEIERLNRLVRELRGKEDP